MLDTLESIYASALKLLEPLSLEETYATIVSEAKTLVNAEHGSIKILNPDKKTFERVYTTSKVLKNIGIRKKGFSYKAFKNTKIYNVDYKDLEKYYPSMKELNPSSVVYVPLSYKNQAIGVLTLESKRKQNFDEIHINILKLFSSFASMAIMKAQLYESLIKALETRDIFISLAAHELRTPLTSLNGYVQLLSRKIPDDETSEGRWVKELQIETRRLTNLIRDLLEINKIKSGNLKLSFQEVDLEETIQRAINNFKFNHPHRKLEYKNHMKEENALVIADPDKIVQVITNLLDNGVKFSNTDSIIYLDLVEKNNKFYLSIEDQGEGIDKKDLNKLFNAFYKGKDNLKEGMGLGLYLSKHIIDQHKGEMRVKSKKGNHTKVTILLPELKK